jgi:predicted SAM-dependent methyltransferase
MERLKRVEHPVGRHLLLRARGRAHAATAGHAVRRRRIDAYLASTPDPRVHIGAGPKRIDGWLNTDLISGDVHLDLERPLPFADASVAHVFGEHVIGSLSEAVAQRLFAEVARVLRPGGVLRVTTPDLAKLVALYRDEHPTVSRAAYLEHLSEVTGRRRTRAAELLNDSVRLWGIRYAYDLDDLRARLLEAGFAEVREVERGESSEPALRGLERHEPAELDRAHVLYVEAVAP